MTKTQTTDALARAIEYLGAVPVGDPDPAHTGPWYAYRSDDDGRWYCIDDETLRHLTEEDLEYGRYAESVHAMPSWWSPERRFAWRINTKSRARNELDFTCRFADEGEAVYAADAAARDFAIRRDSVWHERITIDLSTGEEGPA